MDLVQSEALHARARAWVDAFERGCHPGESFDQLACDLARYQAAHSEGFANLCRMRGVDTSRLAIAS